MTWIGRKRLCCSLQVSLSISLLQDDGQEQDIYESCLTQAEIQGHINLANGKR